MSKLYEKLATERNKYTSIAKRSHVENVLTQLLVIAFTNYNNPDELPNVFYVQHVTLSKESFEALLKNLDISAKVDVVNISYINGFIYEVTLDEK